MFDRTSPCAVLVRDRRKSIQKVPLGRSFTTPLSLRDGERDCMFAIAVLPALPFDAVFVQQLIHQQVIEGFPPFHQAARETEPSPSPSEGLRLPQGPATSNRAKDPSRRLATQHVGTEGPRGISSPVVADGCEGKDRASGPGLG